MTSDNFEIPRTGIWMFPDRPASELVGLVVAAESAGLDEFWIGDEGPAREPFTVLAAAAAATSTITLATGITNPYVRAPALAATTALTIHELSNGRMILGVGAGGKLSLDPLGLTAENPLSHVRSFIATARAATVRRPGPNYVPNEYAIDTSGIRPTLPVFIGARGQKLNRLASEVADGVFVAGLPPARFGQVIGWARSVHDIAVSLYPGVAFDDETIELQRPQMIWGLINTPQHVRDRLGLDIESLDSAATALVSGDDRPARELVTDDLIPELIIAGSPRSVGRQLTDLARTHRPSSIGLALTPVDAARDVAAAAEALALMRLNLKGAA